MRQAKGVVSNTALYAMIVRQVLKATANEQFHVERCPSYIPLSFSDMTASDQDIYAYTKQ